MASGTLTSNTSTSWVRLPKGDGMFSVSGTFGSGTAQLELKGASGAAIEITDAAWSSASAGRIDLGADVEVRITLAGATNPSIAWDIRPQRDV